MIGRLSHRSSEQVVKAAGRGPIKRLESKGFTATEALLVFVIGVILIGATIRGFGTRT